MENRFYVKWWFWVIVALMFFWSSALIYNNSLEKQSCETLSEDWMEFGFNTCKYSNSLAGYLNEYDEVAHNSQIDTLLCEVWI